METETKDIICSYQDANGIVVDKMIGVVTKVKLPTEKMNILNRYLETLHYFQVVSFDSEWEDEEEYSLTGDYL